jgi:hypothetical protein
MKNLKLRHLAVAAALTAAPFVFASAAVAEPATATAQVIGTVQVDKNDPTIASVHVRYVCQPGEQEQWLFVSAKQTADAQAHQELTSDGEWSTGEGNVNAWLQNHPFGEFTCDGRSHTQKFEINTQIDGIGNQGYGAFQKGDVWVQFCLFDGQGNFIYDYEWVHAR